MIGQKVQPIWSVLVKLVDLRNKQQFVWASERAVASFDVLHARWMQINTLIRQILFCFMLEEARNQNLGAVIVIIMAVN